MTIDLSVDTALLRQAADLLEDAAAAFDGGAACVVYRCPLTDSSLGSSALAREVVSAAARRVEQGVEATRMLAAAATDTGVKLRIAADTFDAAEMSGSGPR